MTSVASKHIFIVVIPQTGRRKDMARAKKEPEAPKAIPEENRNTFMRKTTKREPEDMEQLVSRLNRVEGQIRGIKSMIDRRDYCVDIIVQVMAAKAALDSFNRELLSNHLHNCVVKDIQEGKMEKVDELSELFKRVTR